MCVCARVCVCILYMYSTQYTVLLIYYGLTGTLIDLINRLSDAYKKYYIYLFNIFCDNTIIINYRHEPLKYLNEAHNNTYLM